MTLDREKVASVIAEWVGWHTWENMAADRADLRDKFRGSDGYDINEPTRDDCLSAADEIIAMVPKPKRRKSKPRCKNGHEFTPENTYSSPKHPQFRVCRQCQRDRNRMHDRAKRAKFAAMGLTSLGTEPVKRSTS